MDVLLVEDEPLVRAAAADALRDAGLVVAEAACAEQALAMGSAAEEPPAVVVADLRLGPGMDGLALGAEARRRWPGVGVVYATGYPDDLGGRPLGPRERYLVKPVAPGALLGAVRRLMPMGALAWTFLHRARRASGAEHADRS
jgi:DNA-binding response OmpR family regulator